LVNRRLDGFVAQGAGEGGDFPRRFTLFESTARKSALSPVETVSLASCSTACRACGSSSAARR